MKRTSITIFLTAAIVLALANYLASRHPLRLDLTQNGVYTLSKSTRAIVRNLNDVLTVRVYFSEKVPPAMLGLRREVDDLLSELKDSAGARINVEHIDPAASAMDEQKAALMGIMPVQLNVYEGDKVEVAKIYLGIAVLYGDKQEVLPVVHSAANLEYELAESILKVSTDKLTRIGWWEGRNGEDEVSPYALIRDALSRRYDVVDIGPAYRQAGKGELVDLDPAELRAVLLVSPRTLGEADLFALDQYIVKGGRLMALIDRSDVGAKLDISPVASDAFDLIAHYGATIEDELLLDESNATAAFTGGPVTYHIPYAFWPEVIDSGFNRESPVTVNLQSAVFPWTSPLSLAQEDADAWIARSTDKSAAIPVSGASLEPRFATDNLAKAARSKHAIAALLKGPFKSYFSGTGKTAPKGAAVLAEGGNEAAIFVTGSSHWIMDKVLMKFPQNADLFQNALDWLSMSDSLMGIRSREGARRPIALLPDAAKSLLRYVNLAIGPMAIGAIGVGTVILRRRRRKKIETRFRKAS
ncbi:MAG: GldG family protein [bacterium]